METLVITIKRKSKAAFTKELLRSFSFLEVKEEKKKTQIKEISTTRRKSLIRAFKEVKLSEEGKLKLKSWDEEVKNLK
jgi:polynucleotide 5'-kinase involved in rRNA processing